MAEVKICFVGESEAGKTALAKRVTLLHGIQFNLSKYKYGPTHPIDFFITKLAMDGKEHIINIYELSNDETYITFHHSLIEKADLIVYCVDMSKLDQKGQFELHSEALKKWKKNFPNANLLLVGTKSDKVDEVNKKKNEDALRKLSQQNSIPFMFDSSAVPNISAIESLHQEFFNLGENLENRIKPEKASKQSSIATPKEEVSDHIPSKIPKEKKLTYPSSYRKICNKVGRALNEKVKPNDSFTTSSPVKQRSNTTLSPKRQPTPISSPIIRRSKQESVPKSNMENEQNYYRALALLEDYCKMAKSDYLKSHQSGAGRLFSAVRSYFWLTLTCHLRRHYVDNLRMFLINHENLSDIDKTKKSVGCLISRLQDMLNNNSIRLTSDSSLAKRMNYIQENLLTPINEGPTPN
ncbi:Rab family GTPase [Legionella gresilensis]|uniref:Rab family GTPase n=1 Tax=Legionella gresilensis TaxID=91823 RepID=UPI0013EF8AA7|nr:ADP-ribosylation factor-like protein [Legionella gresilensis]